MNIEELKLELKKSIQELSCYNFDTFTAIELYYTIANKLNEVIKELSRHENLVSDEIIKQNNVLQEMLDSGLHNEVIDKINNMVIDGTMDSIINHHVLADINSQLQEKASENDLDIERKRIDSFTKLTEGSTTGDAELIDGRIGADGIVYNNIGSANRNQFNFTKDKINNIKKVLNNKDSVKTVNLFDKSTYNENKYVNNTTGDLDIYTDWFASDYIEIKSNTEYLILKSPHDTYIDAQNSYYAFYDENKTYINGGILQSGSILSPETAKYIRFSAEEKNREYIMFGEKQNLNALYGKDKSYYVNFGYVSFKRVDVLEEKFDKLNNSIKTLNIDYPEYYETHLTSKIGVIQEKDLMYGHQGDTFAFITDTHVPENANNSLALLKKIVDNTNVSFVFDCGDVLTQAERSVAIQQAHNHIKNMINTFGDKYKFTLGNHDDNRYLSSDKFSTNETYSLYIKHLEGNNSNTFYESSEKFSYYFDNKKQKIRYICLDSNSGIINYKQIKWLADTGLKFDEEGWSVVIFTHWMFEENDSGVNEFTNTTFVDVMSKIIHAFLNGASYNRSDLNIDVNYANKNGNCCVILCGHTHKDDSMTTQHGIKVICTTCDCYGYGARVDKKGTYEEQAFDICHLDTKNKKLYMTRIGSGEDREFNL